jgi:hypothetical protein
MPGQHTRITQPNRQAWTSSEVQRLRELAQANTPTRVIAMKMERSEASVRSKAYTEGISLKPVNQRPAGASE